MAKTRQNRLRRLLATGTCLMASLVTGCALVPPDTGTPSKRGEWQRVAELSDPSLAGWVEVQREEVGVFQRTLGERTYVLVSWGRRPTGGYSVRVQQAEARGGRLRLTVLLGAPAPGAMVTQMITYPYDLIAVTPPGTYRLAPEFRGAVFLQNSGFSITAPQPYASVEGDIRLNGRARVFEGTFLVTVADDHGLLLQQAVQAPAGAPAWAPFDVTLHLPTPPRSREGAITVYEESAKDGLPRNALRIPVRFGP